METSKSVLKNIRPGIKTTALSVGTTIPRVAGRGKGKVEKDRATHPGTLIFRRKGRSTAEPQPKTDAYGTSRTCPLITRMNADCKPLISVYSRHSRTGCSQYLSIFADVA